MILHSLVTSCVVRRRCRSLAFRALAQSRDLRTKFYGSGGHLQAAYSGAQTCVEKHQRHCHSRKFSHFTVNPFGCPRDVARPATLPRPRGCRQRKPEQSVEAHNGIAPRPLHSPETTSTTQAKQQINHGIAPRPLHIPETTSTTPNRKSSHMGKNRAPGAATARRRRTSVGHRRAQAARRQRGRDICRGHQHERAILLWPEISHGKCVLLFSL